MSPWERARDELRHRVPRAVPKVGLVLGSGLGDVVERFEARVDVPYGEIPHFPSSTVEGHAGQLVFGRWSGQDVVAMRGRVHLYEGYSASEVVFPIRVMLALGAKVLIVTNAAGGIDPHFATGDLMLISDHLNLTGTNPLVGPNDPAWGPRFPDVTHAYDPKLREIARAASKALKLPLHEGVYAGLLGPSYETPAEIRMLRTMGAAAVGMSTVLEVIAAAHAGARILGISCISNPAAGLTDAPLDHEEVQEAAYAAREHLGALVEALVSQVGE